MKFSTLVVLPGADVDYVCKILDMYNVSYWINYNNLKTKQSKLLVNKFYQRNQNYYLKDLQEGMNLNLFNNDFNTLIKINLDWVYNNWNFNIDDDLINWFSNNPKLMFTNKEKHLVNEILNYGIFQEQETLDMYKNVLKPTFLHPQLQIMFQQIIICKQQHLAMWKFANEKLQLPKQPNKPYSGRKIPSCTLENVVKSLAEIIAIEENLYISTQAFLSSLAENQKLVNLCATVKIKNQESQEISNLLNNLLKELARQYPFLRKYIVDQLVIMDYKLENKEDNFFNYITFKTFGNLSLFL